MVQLVCRGLGDQEIADSLHVSLSSVKTYLASVQGKIGARNRVDIVIWAFRNQVVRE